MSKKKYRKVKIVLVCTLCYVAWYVFPFLKGTIHNRYDFDKVVSVIMYDIDPKWYDDYTKQLKSVTQIEVDIDLFKQVIRNTKFKRPCCFLDAPMWKGGNLVIVEFSDGNKLYMAVSYVSSSFFVVGETGYYCVKEKALWQKWRNEHLKRILDETFIPKRKDTHNKSILRSHQQTEADL